MLLHVNNMALRQRIVPNQLLGRVVSAAAVLVWAPAPLGGIIGGWIVEATQNIAFTYVPCGAWIILLSIMCWGSPELGVADNPDTQKATTDWLRRRYDCTDSPLY